MSKHSIDQTAAWAKSWKIKGYEHLYSENRDKQRMHAIKSYNLRQREKLNKSLTQR